MSRTGFDRRDLLVIALGGVTGAALRWWITEAAEPVEDTGFFTVQTGPAFITPIGSQFPWKLLAVNLLGTAILGAIVALRKRAIGSRRLWLAAGAGFCGSLTTYSSFAVEVAVGLAPLPPPNFAGWSHGRMRDDPSFDSSPVSIPGWTLAEASWFLGLSVVGGCVAFVAGRLLANGFARLSEQGAGS